MILLTFVYRKSSLNQVELLDSGHFIQDDSSLSTSKGAANERNCVTNPKFVSIPTSDFSCQELHVPRQSFTKADSSELSLKAFNIASTEGFCLQQRPINHIAIQTFAWVYCSDLAGSEQNVVVQGGTVTTIVDRLRYIAVVCPAIAPQECILYQRDEPNVRTDAYIIAEVDNISRVIKKLKVRCDKIPTVSKTLQRNEYQI